MELDLYKKPKLDYHVLEVESPEEHLQISDLPDFLQIREEVTDQPQYSNRMLALSNP